MAKARMQDVEATYAGCLHKKLKEKEEKWLAVLAFEVEQMKAVRARTKERIVEKKVEVSTKKADEKANTERRIKRFREEDRAITNARKTAEKELIKEKKELLHRKVLALSLEKRGDSAVDRSLLLRPLSPQQCAHANLMSIPTQSKKTEAEECRQYLEAKANRRKVLEKLIKAEQERNRTHLHHWKLQVGQEKAREAARLATEKEEQRKLSDAEHIRLLSLCKGRQVQYIALKAAELKERKGKDEARIQEAIRRQEEKRLKNLQLASKRTSKADLSRQGRGETTAGGDERIIHE